MCNHTARGAIRMTIIRIGLDTSKHVFQIHGVDENEQPVLRRQNRRSEVVKFFASAFPQLGHAQGYIQIPIPGYPELAPPRLLRKNEDMIGGGGSIASTLGT